MLAPTPLVRTVGSTGPSSISSLDRHVFSILHRHLPSHSVGSTSATLFSTIDRQLNYQCTDRFKTRGVGLTGHPFPAASCPIRGTYIYP
jgi:hypothetical protein